MGGCCNTIHTRVQGANLMNEYAECASLQDVWWSLERMCVISVPGFRYVCTQKYALTLFSFFLFLIHTLAHCEFLQWEFTTGSVVRLLDSEE